MGEAMERSCDGEVAGLIDLVTISEGPDVGMLDRGSVDFLLKDHPAERRAAIVEALEAHADAAGLRWRADGHRTAIVINFQRRRAGTAGAAEGGPRK